MTAVGAGVVFGLRVPELLREPDPPPQVDRLAEFRRTLERREAALPFDPDDPGPGASRMFPVVDGVVGGNLWMVSGYHDANDSPCLQLVVAYDFGRRRCLGSADAPIRAVLDIDRYHGATFISGVLAPRIDRLTFQGPEVSFMDVAIGRENPRAAAEPGFFGIALPDEFVAVDAREARRDGGYRVERGRLIAIDAQGKPVARVSLFLARA